SPSTCPWLSETFSKKDKRSSDQLSTVFLVGNYLIKSLPERIFRKSKNHSAEKKHEQGGSINHQHETFELSLKIEKLKQYIKKKLRRKYCKCNGNLDQCWSGIKLDISYAFPSLYIFQKDGPYQDVLYSISGAYSCYRPDVGYVQGMSFIVALFILSLEEAVAFIAFGNLMNKPSQLAFYCVDCSKMLKYFGTSEVSFEGSLFTHFLHIKLDIHIASQATILLDPDSTGWDVFCRDGEEFLFRTGTGILQLYEDIFLQVDFIHIAQFLNKLAEDLTPEKLFSCVAAIQIQKSTS
ncbi:hypothetical protein E2I00_012027, partial [Balaenoptera physalus]